LSRMNLMSFDPFMAYSAAAATPLVAFTFAPVA
jgi:hypothetical protein